MTAVKRILKVPEREETRRYLRQRVRDYLRKYPVNPSARLEILEKMTTGLLHISGMDIEMCDFTIVLLGNETWWDTIAAIPFNRRLLLLPQCLRDQDNCREVFDKLGLICAECNGCHLNSLQDNAEKLGYTTLVAEGTTAAIGLIEEGTIDAVIGISCMPVLNNGCENTTFDYHWLMEEIENYKPNNSKMPVSVNRLKNSIADYFNPPILNDFSPSRSETEKLAMKIMSRGGQRIRPLLAAIACQTCAENPSEEVQKNLALAIECFHKASLVHDDFEDDEAIRYGQPAVHKENGIPAAINLGDFLVGKGYHLLSQLPLDKKVLVDCFRVFSGSHMKLSEGQGEDITLPKIIQKISVEDVIRIFRLKTSGAIKESLLTGTVAGNAPCQTVETLDAFSHWFGVAYQIRDDLHEFSIENRRTDLFDFPFLLVLLKEEMKSTHDFEKIIQHRDIHEFVEKIAVFHITGKAENYFRDYVDRCHEELNKLDNPKLRLALHVIMGRVFKEL